MRKTRISSVFLNEMIVGLIIGLLYSVAASEVCFAKEVPLYSGEKLVYFSRPVSLRAENEIVCGPDAGESEIKIFSSLEEAGLNPAEPLLLVFFSIDCHVCFEDLFEMKYFIEKNRLSLQLVGVTRDLPEEVEAFLSKYSFFYPVICDRKKALYRQHKVDLEPFKVVLAQGRMVWKDDYYKDLLLRREELQRWLLKMNFR